MRTRLIDEIVPEALEKNIFGDLSHICMERTVYEQLLRDYSEQFEVDLIETGRKASKEDLQDFLNINILVGPVGNEKGYKFLKTA